MTSGSSAYTKTHVADVKARVTEAYPSNSQHGDEDVHGGGKLGGLAQCHDLPWPVDDSRLTKATLPAALFAITERQVALLIVAKRGTVVTTQQLLTTLDNMWTTINIPPDPRPT
jgi:hypothetical protein